jgi:tRNA modification GTPase
MADLGPVPEGLAVSAETGAGIPALLEKLNEIAAGLTDTDGIPVPARPRQLACVRETAEALERALAVSEHELRGEELRLAATALGRLAGMLGVEEILDAVFGGFCIGK